MSSEQIAEAQRQARAWLWNRDAPSGQQSDAKNTPARPVYVRRKAEAMRAAKAYFRVVA
jgi:hypothetical protein